MSPSPAANWRILCIDDEPDILEILRTALGLKYEVITASNGVEAVGMLDYCDADFIICDVRMPMMDGFQTVEAIRRHPQYMDVPVFFLTAETAREMAQRGFASGGNLYLTKPFDPMRVLQNIDYFLEQSGRAPRDKHMDTAEVERRVNTSDIPEAPDAAPAEGAASAEPRVIVMGSRAAQVERVHDALRTRCECIVCADPLASLHRLFQYEPDILIINPAIPKLSGWGLLQLIHENPRLRRLPIILLKDPQQELDERIVPSLTKSAPLPPDPAESQIVAAVEDLMETPDFAPRPKSATLAELEQQEKEVAQQRARESEQQQKVEDSQRERYRVIQTFIDKNFR